MNIEKEGDIMTNTELLEKKIDESGYKRSYLANAIGLKSRQALANKIKNESEFTATEINALCDLLKIESLEEKDSIFFTQ